MGVGVEIYGIAGNLQASTDRFTMGLSGHGALLMTDDQITHPQPRVRGTVTVTGVSPVVVVKPIEGVAIFLERLTISGATNTFVFEAVSSQPVAFQYWVFDVASMAFKDPAMANMGLQVFDPTLTLTYDAAMDVLDVRQVVTVTPHATQVGGDIDYSDLTQWEGVSVPAGRSYGVAFCGAAYEFANKATGQFADTPGGGVIGVEPADGEPDPTPPQGAQWRSFRLDTLWPACRAYNGNIEVGMGQVELFNGWVPVNGFEEFIRSQGVARFMIVDVTDLSTTGLPSTPNAPVVQVSASSRTIEVNGPAQDTITPEVSISISGGTPPYSITWEFVSGSNSVAPYGPTNAATFRTIVTGQQPSTSYGAVWRPRVVTATGVVGFGGNVSFNHVSQAYSLDYVPNALTLSNLSLVTNSDHEATSDVTDLTGFNQNITLRVERYNFTGSMDAQAIYVYRGPTAGVWGPWELVGTLSPPTAGLQYVDFTVTPNSRLHYVIDSVTYSGRKQTDFDIVVWNLSNPGGNVQISAKHVTVVIDNDGNFNVADFTPDPISVPNLTGYVSNDPELYTDGRFFQITGVNRQIWLRFIRTYHELVQSGAGMNTRRLLIFKSTTGSGGPWTSYFLGAGTPESPVPYLDIPCQNGDWFYVQGWIVTVAGAASASWRNYIDFHDGTTVLGRLATFDISGTVDANDDYYAADYDLDPIDWGNENANFNENVGAWANDYRPLNGINRQIVIRADLLNIQGINGYPMGDGGNFYIISESRGNLTSIPWRNGGSAYATVNPGERIRFYTDVYTNSGRRDTYFDVNVYNHTTGAFIDHHWSAGIVDADNNWQIAAPDYAPDAISFPYMTQGGNTYGSDPAVNYSQVYTPTGFNQTITMRAYLGLTYTSATANNSSDPFEPNMAPTSGICTMFVVKNGAVVGNTPHQAFGGTWSGQEYYSYLDFSFAPGDQIQFITHFHVDGLGYGGQRDGAIAGNIYLDSLSGGNRLGQFGHDTTFLAFG